MPSKSFLVVAATVLLSVAFAQGLGEAFLVRDSNSRLANAIRCLRSQEEAQPKILFLENSCTRPDHAQSSERAIAGLRNLLGGLSVAIRVAR